MATITINQTDNIQSKISSAQPGDTVIFNGVTSASNITLKNGTNSAMISYGGKLVVTSTTGSALNQPNPAIGISIDGIELNSSCGAVNSPGDVIDCRMIKSKISWKGRTTGYSVNGKATRVAVGGKPENANFFNNSDRNSYRDADFHSTEDVTYSYNKFYKTGYAAHFNGKHIRLRVEGNTSFQTWQVRGIEIQDEGHYLSDVGDDILYRDNVIYDCLSPDVDTFGASIPPQGATNVRVEDCYFSVFGIGQSTPTNGWGTAIDPNRKYQTGYGVETGAGNFWVRRCTFVGPWVCAIVAMRDTHYQNCKSYSLDSTGKSMNQWGTWGTENGNFGQGQIVDEGGNQVLPMSQAPAPWRTLDPNGTLHGTWADGTPVGGTSTPVFSFTATPINDRVLQFAWTNAPSGTAQLRIDCKASNGGQTGTVVGPTPLVSAQNSQVTGYHPGWHIDLIATALNSSNIELGKTASVTVLMPGDPTITPWPPVNTAVTITSITVHMSNGTNQEFVPKV